MDQQVGVLYGRKEILESMPPFQGGGEMIKEVHFEKTTFNDLPINLEAEHPIPGTSSHSDLPIDLK